MDLVYYWRRRVSFWEVRYFNNYWNLYPLRFISHWR